MYKEGLLEMLSVAFPQGAGSFPYIFFSTVSGSTLVTVYDSILFSLGLVLSLGLTSTCLKVLLPLNCVWIPYLAHTFLILFSRPWMYGMTICPMFGLCLGVYLLCCCLSCCLHMWCGYQDGCCCYHLPLGCL